MLSICIRQGLLELFWSVYSEGKLPSSCSKLRKFQNPLKKDKSVGLWDIPYKKMPEICTCCRVKLYFYQSTIIVKAGPGFDDWAEHPSVQINSSSPCLIQLESITFVLFFWHQLVA